MTYTPRQVSEMLNIPPSTIRLYAKLFASQLSPQEGRKQRLYTEQDLLIFARIKDLRSSRTPLDVIAQRLHIIPQAPAGQEESALQLVPSIAAAIESAQAAARAADHRAEQLTGQITQLAQQVQVQQEQLRQIYEWLSLPWYKRIFSPRPQDAGESEDTQ